MLTRLRVKNFRLLRSITLDIAPGHPVVLIGPNSAGKSSVLAVLDILASATNLPFRKALAPYRPARTLGVIEPIEVEVEVSAATDTPVPAGPLRYGVRFDEEGYIEREWASQEASPSGAPAQEILRLDDDRNEHWIWNERLKKQDKIDLDDYDGSSLAFVNFRRKRRSYRALAEIGEALSSIQVYHGFPTNPQWVRDPREGQAMAGESVTVAPATRMDRRGFDLVNVLNSLRIEHEPEWNQLMNAFRGEFPFVSRLDFPPDPGGGKIGLAWWDERFGNMKLYGSQMSEGMLTYLCLLAAIHAPERAAALAFDEPDTHLHPSALRRLVNLLESAATRSAVIVTTHSDRMLDYLSDPAASLRVCAGSREGVSIAPLDREALDAWRKEYTVSALREGRYLDQDNAGVMEP